MQENKNDDSLKLGNFYIMYKTAAGMRDQSHQKDDIFVV